MLMGRVGSNRFFLLFEIKGKEKEKEANAVISESLQTTLKKAVMLKIILRRDLNAVIPDDLIQFFLYAGGESIVADVHIQFYTGIGADTIDIVGAVCHPYAVIGSHLSM